MNDPTRTPPGFIPLDGFDISIVGSPAATIRVVSIEPAQTTQPAPIVDPAGLWAPPGATPEDLARRNYSRPVGWWCPRCDVVFTRAGPTEAISCHHCKSGLCDHVPVFEPIPEGQRPLVEDEAESAEVVTIDVGRIAYCCGSAGTRWTTEPTVEYINYIVTGATE